jgi:acyl-CoA synthetase (AMP-forming)/AMP-acid ligase II
MLVPDLLRQKARELGDRQALAVDRGEGTLVRAEDTHGALTFAAWDTRSDRLATALVAAGVRVGDRVALAFDNADADRFSVGYFATLKAGAVAVPLGVRLVEAEVDVILRHSAPTAVITDARRRAELAGRSEDLTLFGPEDYDRAIATAGPAPVLSRPLSDGDLCDILYTSGTTGAPKGVASTHGDVSILAVGALGDRPGATFLHAIPIFTFAGTQAMQLMPLCAGMSTVVMHRFDARRYLALVAAHRAAVTFAVPSMLRLCVDAHDATPPAERADTSSMRLCIFGSAPMPPSTLQRLPDLFARAHLINIYGLTESGGATCAMPPGEALRRPTSVGKPVPPVQVRIVVAENADEGTSAVREAAPGEVGEIWLRGRSRPRSYFKDAEATRKTFDADGWLHTGDIGHLDADGYLYLDDRRRDLVIRGGLNIFPSEIDALLHAHPAVLEAAVVGVPHDVLGEDLRAYVVLRPGMQASADELRAHLSTRIADYKVPRQFRFIDALPRNALGKVVKRQLRDLP